MKRLFSNVITLVFVCNMFFSPISVAGRVTTHPPQELSSSCVKNAVIQALTKGQREDPDVAFHSLNTAAKVDQKSLTKTYSPRQSVFAVIPENATEFRHIFHYAPSKKQVENLNTYQRDLGSLPTTTYYKEGKGTYLCRFEGHLKNTDADFVTLIGHNENGMFYFPDGNNATFSYLSDLCSQNKKTPIFLSCQAKQFVNGRPAPRSRLTYPEAIGIAHRIQEFFTKAGSERGLSHNDVATEIQRIIDSSQRAAQVKYVTKVTGGVAIVIGIIVVFALDEEEQDKEKK